MMKILLVGVNYNTYDKLRTYIESIDYAALKCPDISVEVYIADNSSEKEIIRNSYKNLKLYTCGLNNLGYIGGASAIVNSKKNIFDYSYVIISNVDIVFHENTFQELLKLKISDNVAWIAPKIISQKDGKNKNPSILERYSRIKLFMLKFTYCKYVYGLYTRLYYSRKKVRCMECPEREIYAGHGSCFIFTRSFFYSYKQIRFPLFLYGEELYFAELIRNVNKKVLYCPQIVISDSENASTSKLPPHKYFYLNKKAIDYILNTFYK